LSLPRGIAAEWCAGVPGRGIEARGELNPWRPSDLFDLASLTKVIVTSTLVAETWRGSGLSWVEFLDQPVVENLVDLRGTSLSKVTVGELWEHRSGLEAHLLVKAKPLAAIVAAGLKHPGKETVYSDLGFLILGLWLEKTRDTPIDSLWTSWKLRHGIRSTRLVYGPVPETQAVPTETRHARGRVNDDNAASLGGVAPHAGVFGHADDVWAWLEALVRWARSEPALKDWLSPAGLGRFHGGWDRPSDPATTHAGARFPRGSVIGHLGYTGTALWWDLKPDFSGRAGVLLTNRVHPESSDESKKWIFELRRQFFDHVWTGTLKGWEPRV